MGRVRSGLMMIFKLLAMHVNLLKDAAWLNTILEHDCILFVNIGQQILMESYQLLSHRGCMHFDSMEPCRCGMAIQTCLRLLHTLETVVTFLLKCITLTYYCQFLYETYRNHFSNNIFNWFLPSTIFTMVKYQMHCVESSLTVTTKDAD